MIVLDRVVVMLFLYKCCFCRNVRYWIIWYNVFDLVYFIMKIFVVLVSLCVVFVFVECFDDMELLFGCLIVECNV